MDSNREEAQRSFKLAQSYERSDPIKSLKLARKSCSLFWSVEASELVKSLEKGKSTTTDSTSTSKETLRNRKQTTTTTTNSNNSAPKPSNSIPNEPLSYKPAQLEIVKKIRKCKPTDYYEILELKRDCEDGQVKTAYRKLALALHPDKNSAPGADEAFKMVSRAFQVLSDPNKRSAFDRHGADPDSRFASTSSNPSPFHRHPSHFSTADEGMDAEQIFRMFFGGGMGGGMFDGPGVQFGGGPTVFQFGGGMPRVRRSGQNTWETLNQNQRRTSNHQEVRTPTTWISFLPIIFFFLISIFQSFPALFSTPSKPDPTFSWTPSTLYPTQRVTHSAGIRYFVNPTEFSTHPFYEEYLKSNPKLGYKPIPQGTNSNTKPKEEETRLKSKIESSLFKFLPVESNSLVLKTKEERKDLKLPNGFQQFEKSIELHWIRKLQNECQYFKEIKETKKRNLMGFLGIGADWEAIKKLDQERIESCDGLRELGYVVQ
ncbi:uncharacterized protein MELLADRAFT_94057 [Melampsora larici-populina 98AG31]|uniref:J domain-containing protein n=1 Tax=Melampsora larici-populina (strain 98AG31 / pathotype 3-4-7) TaxID=747676 RepID=F4S692_MELLP|nr:uncharacterized protein MELLADRAFT_94057 [Melampsora larici-populina 98AG31]EGF99840.1 hypothetical protein MELLADRAFT_94057 [Melampsora larici-populina 98AG31]